MKTCPNCVGDGRRNWEGDDVGNHPCRMCRGRGSILEPSDVAWLAEGWMGADRCWYTRDDPPNQDKIRCAPFSAEDLMVLIAGGEAVLGRITKAAQAEKGMVATWRGVTVHPRKL